MRKGEKANWRIVVAVFRKEYRFPVTHNASKTQTFSYPDRRA
jgi:hypothetical protein